MSRLQNSNASLWCKAASPESLESQSCQGIDAFLKLTRRLQEGPTSSAQNFTAGTFAAVAATVLTQPTDVIRTHMQLGQGSMNARLGILAVMKAIVSLNGPKALLAGAMPRVSLGPLLDSNNP